MSHRTLNLNLCIIITKSWYEILIGNDTTHYAVYFNAILLNKLIIWTNQLLTWTTGWFMDMYTHILICPSNTHSSLRFNRRESLRHHRLGCFHFFVCFPHWASLSSFGFTNISWLQLVLNVRVSICPSVRLCVRPSIRPSTRSFVHSCFAVCCVRPFVTSARSYPSASLRNANAFCFSFTMLSNSRRGTS